MKKLVLSVAVLLGSLTTFAAVAPVQNSVEKVITVQDEYTEIKLISAQFDIKIPDNMFTLSNLRNPRY